MIDQEKMDVPKSDKNKLWAKLLHKLEKGTEEKQSDALLKCIKLMTQQARKPSIEGNYCFPEKLFLDILMKLLSPQRNNENLILQFKENADYPDVLFHFWRCLPKIMLKESHTNMYYKNFLELVNKMVLPKGCENAEYFEDKELLCGNSNTLKWDYQIVKRALNKVWGRTKSWNLSPQLQKKHLLVLIERIMQHLQNPILSTDFLMSSLNKRGAISFLALQGVFVLVTKYNIEVPQIYGKLYQMFQPEIFHSKYKPRLFYLTDIFLSSTHLPESLVASFAKRLSRLALIAPPEDIIIILMLVGNLIIRHPGLKKMINYPINDTNSEAKICKEDLFLEENNNPFETNAIESSLWEIRTLEKHVLPSVASASKFIRQQMPSVEYDMGSKLEETGGDIFERELKKMTKDVALNFERPKSMALQNHEKVSMF